MNPQKNQNSIVALTKVRLALMACALFLSLALPSIGAYVSLSTRVTRNETTIRALVRVEAKIDKMSDRLTKLEVSVKRLETKIEFLEKTLSFEPYH